MGDPVYSDHEYGKMLVYVPSCPWSTRGSIIQFHIQMMHLGKRNVMPIQSLQWKGDFECSLHF